jgi:CRP-like cAMP-binding protein
MTTLANLNIFKDIDNDEIEKILNCSKAVRKKYREGEFIFRQFEKPKYMFVILKGSAVISKDFESGRQDILLSVSEGDVLGEIFFNEKMDEYWYDATATTEVEALLLPWAFFYGFCEKACARHQTITKNMLGIFSERNYEIIKKAHILSCNILRERITLWLLNSKGSDNFVKMNMNREQLAAYLGTTRPSLSRELMKMQEENLINVLKDKIEIKNLE